MSRHAQLVLGTALLLPIAVAAGVPVHEIPEWDAVADVETVEVLTRNADGTRLHTTVWLAVVEGQGYVRAGSSRWGENVRRDPEVELRVGDEAFALGVLLVEDDALRERIHAAFREKYGLTDAFLSLFRSSDAMVLRLTNR